jgi:GAF domain-containing protein
MQGFPQAGAALEAPSALPAVDERRILYEIIRTISSSVDLEEVLRAIVRLVSEGTQAQSCYVWLVEPDGRLVLRAATEQYAEAIGRASMRPGEGFAGWVIQSREPIFIPEDALADPRARYFPEFEEEKFQSMVSVPLIARAGDAFGVISLHAPAPRVFTDDDARFVLHAAALVAGAVENARLYEATRQRVRVLERLAELGEAAARASTLEELLPIVVAELADLVGADEAHAYLAEAPGRLRRHASCTPGGGAERRVVAAASGDALLAQLWPNVPGTLAAPLGTDGETGGYLVVRAGPGGLAADARDLATTVAAQTAIAIRKIELIEGLTEKNLTKDFFADLAAGRSEGVATRAARLGCDLARPRLAVVAVPFRPETRGDLARLDAVERFERAVSRALPGVLFDRRDDATRGLVPVLGTDEAESVARLRRALAEDGDTLPLVVGVSSACVGADAVRSGLDEAAQAAAAAPVVQDGPGLVTFDGLGPYKYLLRVEGVAAGRDRHRDALRRLLAYDRSRRTDLVRTLDEYLARRGNIAATAQALYVHPNTLRQRLQRIRTLTGIDLRSESWLVVELALKLLRLEETLDRS